jgi:ring-1,2-phenylacetyl-CoA epoxidase subunit PaaD
MGILPPASGQDSSDGASPLESEPDSGRAARCPFCGSGDTELLSSFGSQLSTEQHYCLSCRTPFEYMRQEDAASS